MGDIKANFFENAGVIIPNRGIQSGPLSMRWIILIAGSLAFAGAASLSAEDVDTIPFEALATQRILEQPNVRGDHEDWFFLVKELRHLGTGNFWEKPWDEVAVNKSDPLPYLVEFHNLLAERGVQLVLAPVPTKAATYPGHLVEGRTAGSGPSQSAFLDLLKEAGLSVIDIEPELRKFAEMDPKNPVFCRQDAHLSPLGIELLARSIAKQCRSFVEEGEADYQISEATDLEILGDQVAGSEWEGKIPREKNSIRYVSSSGVKGIESSPESPVLLLGDSHTLVFHSGESTGMHCKGGGLADHLSFLLKQPVDLIGVRGSGMVQARKQLFYHATAHPDYWAGKKVVVWVFSVREFTQSRDRFIPIPLDR